MSKPNDIDAETWNTAFNVLDDLDPTLLDSAPAITTIARAIMKAKADENEVCAKIAEIDRRSPLAVKVEFKPAWVGVAELIATDIRKRLSP